MFQIHSVRGGTVKFSVNLKIFIINILHVSVFGLHLCLCAVGLVPLEAGRKRQSS